MRQQPQQQQGARMDGNDLHQLFLLALWADDVESLRSILQLDSRLVDSFGASAGDDDAVISPSPSSPWPHHYADHHYHHHHRHEDDALMDSFWWCCFDEQRTCCGTSSISRNGITPLHFACLRLELKDYSCDECLLLLLCSGADPNVQDANGETPLHLAIRHNFASAVSILLKHGAKVTTATGTRVTRNSSSCSPSQNRRCCCSSSPIRLAFLQGNAEITQAMLAQDVVKRTPMLLPSVAADFFGREDDSLIHPQETHVLLQAAMVALVKQRDDGVDVNAVNEHGDTALRLAVRRGLVEHARFLLEDGGADPNLADREGEDTIFETPLMAALRGNSKRHEMMELLLDFGADPNVVDFVGKTVLCYAVEEGYLDCVNLLLGKGAVADHVDKKGVTLLLKACEVGELEMVFALLRSSPQTNLCLAISWAQKNCTENCRGEAPTSSRATTQREEFWDDIWSR